MATAEKSLTEYTRAELLITAGRKVKTFGRPSSNILSWRRGLPQGSYSEGHNVLTDTPDIPREAVLIGDRTEFLFMEHYKRPRRWDILFIPQGRNPLAEIMNQTRPLEGGRFDPLKVEELGKGKAYAVLYRTSAQETKKIAQAIPEKGSKIVDLSAEIIDLDKMNDEEIDEDTAFMLESALCVEEYLSDYGSAGETDFRIWGGLNSAYHQWIEQESLHIIGLEQILLRTNIRMKDGTIKNGFRTSQEIRELRRQIKQREWIEPFITPDPVLNACELTVYPMEQEEITAGIYHAAAARCIEKAPTVAKLLRMIAGDENDHYNWFTVGVAQFAKFAKEATTHAIGKVIRNFYMPADEILDPKAERLKSFHSTVGVNRYSLARHLYTTTMRLVKSPLFDFLDPSEVRTAVSEYAEIDPNDDQKFRELILTRPAKNLALI
ncbi:MAG: hypothetical protein G01um10147_766 [Microgenomates group bacterium Gr01-1014_7]|nr:MAG: hypothetical protein G01um10147_766 [Microgenomates group bacterium Gr01-1014_7]